MGEKQQNRELATGIGYAMARTGRGQPDGLRRLTGGATMESWHFTVGREAFVLRRAPSLEFMEGRPFGHDVEAAIIRAAHDAGIKAPEVVAELAPEDGIGSGFIMRALPGTPDPRAILAMDDPAQLLAETAADLARIHALETGKLPDSMPDMDYTEGIAGLRQQFTDAGGDRPIIALGLKWLGDHVAERTVPVLNHGDYRLGNILAQDSHLTGVLDWELAHLGDPHEDLAFGCMTVWRFARIDRPALGLGSLEEYFAAYEAAGGQSVDRERFRFWLIYRTVWWALGCLRMVSFWRSGDDRMLERPVISRRTSENELDLLLLLEEDAPAKERAHPLPPPVRIEPQAGEASAGEIATAIAEWLGTVKDRMEGHDRFQLAVARNALGMIARSDSAQLDPRDKDLSDAFLAGERTLREPGLLAALRRRALDKLSADIPKYPALAVARAKWTGEN